MREWGLITNVIVTYASLGIAFPLCMNIENLAAKNKCKEIFKLSLLLPPQGVNWVKTPDFIFFHRYFLIIYSWLHQAQGLLQDQNVKAIALMDFIG